MTYSDALARSQVMPLQSSKEHKVNGMTSTAICSPSPQPSLSRERGPSLLALFYGDPSTLRERAGVRGAHQNYSLQKSTPAT